MDLSCIISSGDLELYVLGMLPEKEARQMEELMSIFPEIRKEVDRISETIEAVANESEHVPSPSVKDKLFESLKNQNAESKIVPIKKTEDENKYSSSSFDSDPKVINLKRRVKYQAAAVIIGLIAGVAGLVMLVKQNHEIKNDVIALQQENQQRDSAYNNLYQLVHDENYQLVNLEAVAGKPKSLVKLFWNKKTTDVYIMDISLPAAPPQKQYQLWAIVDGKPVSAGMLNDNKEATQKMQSFAKADAFAITLEKSGGSESPTLDQMYVMGKTS